MGPPNETAPLRGDWRRFDDVEKAWPPPLLLPHACGRSPRRRRAASPWKISTASLSYSTSPARAVPARTFDAHAHHMRQVERAFADVTEDEIPF